MANIKYPLGIAALTGFFLISNPLPINTQTPTAPSQETLVEKLNGYIENGKIKPEYHDPNGDFISMEWDDRGGQTVYLCKKFNIGGEELLAFYVIGELPFPLPYTSPYIEKGFRLLPSENPFWIIFKGREYKNEEMNTLDGDEIDVTSSPLPPNHPPVHPNHKPLNQIKA